MLNSNGVISMNEDNTCVCFMNNFAMNEYWELLGKVMEHMLDDLSKITGLDKEVMMKDYIRINDYDPIKEVLKQRGRWDDANDESLVLRSVRVNAGGD